jgi:hypothetical protein
VGRRPAGMVMDGGRPEPGIGRGKRVLATGSKVGEELRVGRSTWWSSGRGGGAIGREGRRRGWERRPMGRSSCRDGGGGVEMDREQERELCGIWG